MITQKQLKMHLKYDQDTGVFTWVKTSRTDLIGKVAGTPDKKKYIQIQLLGKLYKAHRLAWLWMTGQWPGPEVDHINTVTNDNAWSNLRNSTQNVNRQNIRQPKKNNKSGVLGVIAKRNRWRAAICVNGKTKYLGTYDSKQQAHEAYIIAKRRLHPGNTL